MDVSKKDFQPINHWACERGSEFLIDMTTGKKYWNEPQAVVGFKSFLLTAATPFVHAVAATILVASKALQLLSLSHFWMQKEKPYCFSERLGDAGKDLLKIIAAPLVIVGLELSAIYGIFRPYDGRKLYASFERFEYGHFILAPCFQPSPERHLLGGIEIGGAKF